MHLETLEKISAGFSGLLWGTPLLVLLLGGGLFFLLYSGGQPLRYLRHTLEVLRGLHDREGEAGQINHYQALTTALSATVGMGNISGVAVGIATGGPGAIFWMWVSALFGVVTNFYTCSLAVMYRGRDSAGELQGGPMYVITEGLGRKWRPLAVWFCLAGMIGVLPLFQVNQYTQALREIALPAAASSNPLTLNLAIGTGIALVASLVIFGGIHRIGKVAGSLVPLMSVLYAGAVLIILFRSADRILPAFSLIFTDAFSAKAAMGGALGQLIILGIKRGTFSNEAGLGTVAMAHGAAKTDEPIREGLVSMLGPIIDTLFVCTLTALAIIVTGAWNTDAAGGIGITAAAFSSGIPAAGSWLLLLCITFFAMSTLFAYPYYGTKCAAFVFGVKYGSLYNYLYIISILVGATASLEIVINVIDGFYAMMAIPTMISGIWLAPKVREASRRYFAGLKASGKSGH
jgi:alanine or glycine:cation symporter, AGCS family